MNTSLNSATLENRSQSFSILMTSNSDFIPFQKTTVSEQQAKCYLSKMDSAKIDAVSAMLICTRFATSVARIPAIR